MSKDLFEEKLEQETTPVLAIQNHENWKYLDWDLAQISFNWRSFFYQHLNETYRCFYDGYEVQFLKRNFRYQPLPLIHRIGGPAKYRYDGLGSVFKLKWLLRSEKYSTKEYWKIMATMFDDLYKVSYVGNDFYFHVNDEKLVLPAPHSIKSRNVTWKLFGKRVSMEEYWSYCEKHFAPLVHHANGSEFGITV